MVLIIHRLIRQVCPESEFCKTRSNIFRRPGIRIYDTYERIVEDDVKASAAIIAAAVYELAMRDELLPRLPKDKMPEAPTPRER